ncbi:MAG: hypothetical protein DMF70_10055 [Acidobacteria bacterium]|nr:MAG: hypothetical protein DMF70_10055 [Acidobacteriota bacterium]
MLPAGCSLSNLKGLSLIQTRLPACVITKGKCSATGPGVAPGVATGMARIGTTGVTRSVATGAVSGVVFASLSIGFAGRDPSTDGLAGFASGVGVASGTGGRITGKNFSSLGANFSASSGDGNSIATKVAGISVRTGDVANSKRAVASASEFALRNLMIDWNSFGGSASFMIGSAISPAPPVLKSWPTLRTSPYTS